MVKINRNKEKIELFKLNNKFNNKIVIYHLENENLVLKKLLKNMNKMKVLKNE